jgi:hypothetical protein
MAYDLLRRKEVPGDYSITSSIDVSISDPTSTSADEKTFIARLAVLKMNAEGGGKNAKKAWKAALANLVKLQKRAKKGDPKASHLIIVLRESGLFENVKAMKVSGNDVAQLSPKARKLVSLLGQVKTKALQGDARALNLVGVINALHLEKVTPAGLLSGDSDQLEELKLRAEAGDARAQRQLEALRKSNSKTSGDDLVSSRQTARKLLEDAADSKTISRTDLKRAIMLYAGNEATVDEKTAVGSKILAFLQKKNVRITS